jgi:hypothetical protein
MFGFLSTSSPSAGYRSAYARCCQFQRRHYGLRSLPVLSYEAVFLYLVWLEASGAPLTALPQQGCCRLRRLRTLPDLDDAAAGEFCASVGLLLAGVKLEDDRRDGGRLASRLGRRWLTAPIRRSAAYFERLDPGFGAAIGATIEAHLAIERSSRPVDLAVYARPTADAFGHVFRRLPGVGAARGDLLEDLGRHIGTAIIAFDCAIDWPRDRVTGSYNPLPGGPSLAGAIELARTELASAERACRVALGDASEAAAHLARVRDDLGCLDGVPVPVPTWRMRWALATGIVASMAQTQSQPKSDPGAGCAMVICCGLCAFAMRGKLQGTSTAKKDCAGNTRVEHRSPGACDC